MRPLVIDSFAGGGRTSEGICAARNEAPHQGGADA